MFLYKIVKQSHQRLYKPGMMSPPFFVLNQIQKFFSTRKVDNLRLQTIREL